MSTRLRIVLVAVVTVLAVGAAGGYVWSRVAQEQRAIRAEPDPASVADLDDLLGAPRIVFRSTARDATYGRVSVVALEDPSGPRAVTDTRCERVFATATDGLCLTADRGAVTTYRTQVLDDRLAVLSTTPLTGEPSRARMSADGSLAATTTFVTGHSYMSVGFSTETLVADVVDGRWQGSHGNVEDFELLVDGQQITAVDRNIWGVTFTGDGDTFYATAASGGTTWLVRGSLAARRLESLATDAECPSLSPDGTRVVYKKQGPAEPGRWRLAVRDLATGEETLLAETRSVDDQVEWLDDDRIVYGLPREGADAAVTDVWVVAVEGAAAPEVLIPQAWSPAVVRG